MSYSLIFFPIYYFDFIPWKHMFFLFFHIWSAIPDFFILPHTTAFWCSSSLTFNGRYFLPLYTLPQLQRMEFKQFLAMLYSFGGLTQTRYFQSVDLLLNIVLISYGLHIFWIFLTRPLTLGRQTIVSFQLLFSGVQSRFLGVYVMLSG